LKLVCLQNILIDNARRGAGEVIDVSEETAASLIKQGLAASVENDAEEITDKLTAEDSSVTIDVSEETAASLIKQGLAASVENDAEEITDKSTAEDSSVTEEKETPDYKQIKRKRGRPRKR
jgi:hypothetical protein